MIRRALALVVMLAAGPARADECDVLAASFVEKTGASFVRRSGSVLHLSHPLASSVTVNCASPRNAYIGFDQAFPAPAAFDLLAQSASLIGVDGPKTRAAALACQKRALKDRDGESYVNGRGFQVPCTEDVSPAPGRSSFSVSVRP